MKLLFFSSFAQLILDPDSTRVSGGAELQVALLARELARRDIDTVIASSDIGQADGEVLQGVKTRTAGKFHTGALGDTLKAMPRVAKVLAEEKPTHVLVLGWTAWLFVLYILKFFYRYKLVFICGLDTELNGEFARENPFRGILFEFAMRRCDLRFAMTKLQERLFTKSGMDCALYRNLLLPRAAERKAEKTIDFLWVARCQPIKQPLLFLELVESVPTARCEMICPREDANLWEAVEAAARRLPNLVFRDGVPYHEIQAHYDAAHVFVNTSTYEGWPNSFIQAGLGHTAILSLQVRPDNLFDDYRLGQCADGDMEKLKKTADKWEGHPEITGPMGEEAARFVAELHDNVRETDAFLAGLGVTPP